MEHDSLLIHIKKELGLQLMDPLAPFTYSFFNSSNAFLTLPEARRTPNIVANLAFLSSSSATSPAQKRRLI